MRIGLVFLVAVLLTVAASFVSNADINDAEIEAQHYCDMVHQGHWPDFKRIGAYCK